MTAIPTMYGGVQFRSRLEAKWAAMFDLLLWRWEYEPCDLNGWIPDFVLLSDFSPVYVEVKPAMALGDAAYEQARSKIEASGVRSEALICGAALPSQSGTASVGWIAEICGDEFVWDEASAGLVGTGQQPRKRWDFCHASFSFRGRLTGYYDGRCFGQGGMVRRRLDSFWRCAGNKVQWRPPS